jgi:glycosyltransferase involved in cell wall biosynthesis
MKLLVVDQDGVSAHDRGIWRALGKRTGTEVILVVPKRWRVNGQFVLVESEKSDLRVLPLTAILAGRAHRAFYPALRRLVRETTPDILYVNAEPESFLGFQGAWIKHSVGPPMKYILMSWRNIDYSPGGFPYKMARVHDWAEKYSLRMADACVVRNAEAASILRKKGFARSVVIPPAVDRSVFYPAPGGGQLVDERHAPWVVGYVGRINSQKGIDTLLTAASSMGPEVSVLITGEGPEKATLQLLARSLGIADRVRWESAIAHSDVREYFMRVNALVLPSRTGISWKEQFGRVLIESMACGVPVVGSDSGEIPNVIGDAGIVVPEGDPRALADALLRLRNDVGLRRELITKGHSRIDSLFSIDAVLPRYEELLSRLAVRPLSGNEV